MAKQKIVTCADVITALCSELKYSRSHVARILRENHEELRATFDGQWKMPESSIVKLRRLVRDLSGPRYKLGETGPNLRG